MKSYFIGLFQYNDWANQKLLICLQKNKVKDEEIRKLFSHIIAAQEVWFNRIENESLEGIELWGAKEIIELIQDAHDSSERWNEFLETYPMSTFEEVIAYTNTKGASYESKLSDIITHVINHGTHHRAQIQKLLRQQEIEPPALDYIFFCRDHVKS